MTNLLQAIIHLAEYTSVVVPTRERSTIRIQKTGDSLEYFIKDIFCDTILETNENIKQLAYSYAFSWLGNANNPPNMILKGGDALEIKKIQSATPAIALNSSYPKQTLKANNHMVLQSCRDCEDGWQEKDLIYIIGQIKEDKLFSIWMVQGRLYAADEQIYTRIRTKISEGLREIPEIEFAETNELAGVKKVDPLGITNLRIRGMWHIKHPANVFHTLENRQKNILNTLITEKKYLNFPAVDRTKIEQSTQIKVNSVSIQDPNNPAKLLQAKHIYIAREGNL